MNLRRQQILNRLNREVPEGLPVTGRWLQESIGASRQLVQIYVKNNWLDNPCRGIYVRNISRMTWESTLLSLQKICQLDCYIAGITALQLLGFIQYLQFNNKVCIMLRGSSAPPLWLAKLNLPVIMQYQGRQLFRGSDIGFTEYTLPGFSDKLKISSVPKAFLEILADVTDEDSFFSAYEIFEGMTSLSPNLVHELLAECRNIKVKRLFFLMLEKAGHQWGNKINIKKYDLGSGKRSIIKGGKFNNKYAVTVPSEFHD